MAYFPVSPADYQYVNQVTLDPSSINANSISVETFTVPGVIPYARYLVSCPTIENGLFLQGGSCTTAGVLTLSIWNNTNASVNPASQIFYIIGL